MTTNLGQMKETIASMKSYFDAGHTMQVDTRKKMLKDLFTAIEAHSDEICEAVFKDFHKSREEMLVTEIYPVLSEIKHTLSHVSSWSKPKSILSNILIQPSSSKIYKTPKGLVLIFAPWNYSFYLAMMPFVSAIAAGNVVLLKPAHETANVAAVIQKIIHKVVNPSVAQVILGEGKEIADSLFSQYRFDHVFFTGSTQAGSWIAQKCSEKLTPFTLELGGKSPAVVDKQVNLDIAAKRIVWGKYLNAGQTCVCPDYALVHKDVEEEFISLCKKHITELFGTNALESENYTHIINHQRFDKIISYLTDGTLLYGGKYDKSKLCIEPTLIRVNDLSTPIMKEEIFGPVLPIITYQTYDEALSIIRQNRNPLSFYVFTKNNEFADKLFQNVEFGGGCSNNVIIHLGNPSLPFGGVQQSGMGSYHGKWGFDTFSNLKPVVHFAKWFDISLHYHPYTKNKLSLIKRFFGL